MKYIEFAQDKQYDLILVGRVAIDFNPLDYFKTLAESETFKKYVGGSPANIAVGLSRLNKRCGFLSRVSDDRFGDYVVGYFEKEGIDTSHIRRCEHGEKIGLTFTEILDGHTSSILMYRNKAADLALEPKDVDEEYVSSAKAVLISGTALAESPSREAALKTVALAKKNDVRVIFDIDYREYNWKNPDEIAICYSAVAKDADLIMGSREEFDLTEKFLGLDGTDEASAKYWLGQRAKIVVIKHGRQGSAAYTSDGKSYSIKPFPVKAVKSFGGGDGYGSSFINGLLEGWDTFIMTLAVSIVFRGFANMVSNGSPIRSVSDTYNAIGQGYLLGVPIQVYIYLFLAVAAAFVMYKTKFGRSVYAIGGNAEVARLSGVNVKRVRIAVYIISGVLAAVAAVIGTARLGSCEPTLGADYHSDAIAATVIGGTIMSGGEGSQMKTIAGVLILGVLNNMLNLLSVSPYWQYVFKGGIIILAVSSDVLRRVKVQN